MSKFVKWVLIAGAAFIVLIIAAIVIVPFVIDVNKYKPQIEALASEQIGRPLILGGDLKPSVFPWIGIGMRDIHLGNTPAFAEKDLVSIDEIEVRVKLLPILSGRYEIKRFIIKGARIALIKSKDGKLNTQGLGPSQSSPAKTETPPSKKSERGSQLPVKGLMAEQIALKDCSIAWIDHAAGRRKEVTAINLVLGHVSFITPIQLDFSAIADGHPIALRGSLGPLGETPGKEPLDMDLTASLLKTVVLHLKGRLENVTQTPHFNMMLAIDPFSPRDLLANLKQPLPFEPADKSVLQKISLQMGIKGTPETIVVSKGVLHLDQTTMKFSANAKELAKPNLKLSASLDELDLDRYLPPSKEAKTDEKEKEKPAPQKAEKTDYAPLRKLVLDASIHADALSVKNSRFTNIQITATARDGVFKLNPLDMELFQGKLAATGKLDVRRDQPQTQFNLDLGAIQAGPLVKNFLNKELIQGALNAAIQLSFDGDQVDLIRETIDGKGELKFNDGAIVGIDLADMVRNVQSAFGLAEKPTEKPKTDFSELMVAFAMTNGLMKLDNTTLNSPLLRLTTDGNVNLKKETLDLRINPKFVATLVGQGDKKSQRKGVTVPVLVKGTFEKPKFEPDLKGLLNQPLPGTEKLSKDIEQTKKNVSQDLEKNKKKITKDLEKKTQELLKGLPFGN